MQRLLFLVLLLFAANASAATFFTDIGIAETHRVANGDWYQEGIGYPDLKLTTHLLGLGIAQPLSSAWAFEAEYLQSGHLGVDSQDVPDDANYSVAMHRCNGSCMPLVRVHGSGYWSSLLFGLDYHITPTFSMTAGADLFSVRWAVQVTDGRYSNNPQYIQHIRSWHVRSYVGVAWKMTPALALIYRYLPLNATGDGYPSIFDAAHVLSLRISL